MGSPIPTILTSPAFPYVNTTPNWLAFPDKVRAPFSEPEFRNIEFRFGEFECVESSTIHICYAPSPSECAVEAGCVIPRWTRWPLFPTDEGSKVYMVITLLLSMDPRGVMFQILNPLQMIGLAAAKEAWEKAQGRRREQLPCKRNKPST